jgi:hypothetical protein
MHGQECEKTAREVVCPPSGYQVCLSLFYYYIIAEAVVFTFIVVFAK